MIKTPSSTVIGGAGIWTPSATIIGSLSNLAQAIKSIFANNEQGIGWGLNDFSTLYQDAAGTIPVTGVGQPVGLVLDKSKGLVLGGNLSTGIVGGHIPLDSIAESLPQDPLGTKTSNWFPVEPSSFYKIYAPISNRTRIQVKDAVGNITYLKNYESVLSANNATILVLPSSVFMRVYFANEAIGNSVTTFEARKLSGNHAFQTVSASRPILQRNATTGAYYLAFDGVDDFLQTNNIDFTMTDKISLFAGVRKLSDAATTVVAELGADSITVNGTFGLFAPASGGATKFQFISRGAAANYAQSTDPLHSAPLSAVLRCVGTISTQKSEIYVNSALAGKSPTGLIGAINYGNYPLYIGRRNGTSLPFSGHIYSLICISRLTTDAETLALEKAIAKLTGVALNV